MGNFLHKYGLDAVRWSVGEGGNEAFQAVGKLINETFKVEREKRSRMTSGGGRSSNCPTRFSLIFNSACTTGLASSSSDSYVYPMVAINPEVRGVSIALFTNSSIIS